MEKTKWSGGGVTGMWEFGGIEMNGSGTAISLRRGEFVLKMFVLRVEVEFRESLRSSG